jgi:hypothetical protein
MQVMLLTKPSCFVVFCLLLEVRSIAAAPLSHCSIRLAFGTFIEYNIRYFGFVIKLTC